MTTFALSLPRLPTLHWRRIGATATTLALHLLLGLILLLPTAPPLPERTLAQEKITASVVEPPPQRELPPPIEAPLVRHLPTPVRKATPTPTPAPPVEVTTPTMPSPPIDTHPTIAPNSSPGHAATDSGPSASVAYLGSTRVVYPKEALRAHEHGRVLLHVLVGADGVPQQIEIEKSSGSPRLDHAAREAVLHWHFVAALEHGVAVAAWARVPIEFNLDAL